VPLGRGIFSDIYSFVEIFAAVLGT